MPDKTRDQKVNIDEFLVKMNKSAIQTFNFFMWGSWRKTARILEAISQDFRRRSECRKFRKNKHVTSNWYFIDVNNRYRNFTNKISLWDSLSLSSLFLCLWRSDLGIHIFAVSRSHADTRTLSSDQLVAEAATHTTRRFILGNCPTWSTILCNVFIYL